MWRGWGSEEWGHALEWHHLVCGSSWRSVSEPEQSEARRGGNFPGSGSGVLCYGSGSLRLVVCGRIESALLLNWFVFVKIHVFSGNSREKIQERNILCQEDLKVNKKNILILNFLLSSLSSNVILKEKFYFFIKDFFLYLPFSHSL